MSRFTSTKSSNRERRKDDERLPLSQQPAPLDQISHVLALQRSAGNQAVSRMLQSRSGTSSGLLTVSQPEDSSELQADRVAEQVMASPGKSDLQHGSDHETSTVGQASTAGVLQNLGSGQPLDLSTRALMEPRFGVDFSPVRVHSGREASRSARDVNARAFTVGRDVVFGEREYQPHTGEGRRLLAHELTHVVQQSAGAPMLQRVVALSGDDYKALAEQLYQAMKGLGTDEEAIHVTLQKLEKDATAIAKLKEVYKKEYKGADLEAEIRSEMSGSELTLALELLGVKDDPKSADIVGTIPTTDAQYTAVAKKLYAAMKPLGTDEEAIYGLLMPFNRDATKLTKLKTAYQAELAGGLTGKGLEADIKDEMSSDELAYALFLLNAPPPATAPVAEATVVKPGTEEHKSKVGGGTVSARKGVDYNPAEGGTTRIAGFSVGYEGGQSAESRWLQFIWSEVVATQADGSLKWVADKGLPASNGTMDLTTDPSSPKYKVDGKKPLPFYEGVGRTVRTGTSTTLYDRPAEFTDVILKQFDAGGTKVVERDHFDDFLIRDYQTLYHVSIVVEWDYTSKTVSAKSTTVSGGSKVDALPAGFKEQLISEFPEFDYIM